MNGSARNRVLIPTDFGNGDAAVNSHSSLAYPLVSFIKCVRNAISQWVSICRWVKCDADCNRPYVFVVYCCPSFEMSSTDFDTRAITWAAIHDEMLRWRKSRCPPHAALASSRRQASAALSAAWFPTSRTVRRMKVTAVWWCPEKQFRWI